MYPRILLPTLLFILLSQVSHAQSDFYSTHWSKVYRFELDDLTKSASDVVDTIYYRAKREKNIPQLTKALIYQSKFALTLQSDAQFNIVVNIKKEITEASGIQKSLLQSILADIYWQYFKANPWKYYERSTTERNVNQSDFRTWDARGMFREISALYQRSLQDKSKLRSTKLSAINDILIQGENSRVYRPTLYDFLMHNALDFYKFAESSYPSFNVGTTELLDPKYFTDFHTVIPTNNDSSSAAIALRLFKDLLDFHKDDNDPSPYISIVIERTKFLGEESTLRNKEELQIIALRKLKSAFKSSPASALIDFEIAMIYHNQGDQYDASKSSENQFRKRDALRVCDSVMKSFPKSEGAMKCSLLRKSILQKSLNLTTETYIPINKPSRLEITYTNIDSLSFRVYEIRDGFETLFYSANSDSLRFAYFSSLTPITQWTTAVTNLDDHQSHRTEVVLQPLARGRYFILCNVITADALPASGQIYAYERINVTNIAFLESELGTIRRYQVVERNNGKPIEGANFTATIIRINETGRNDSVTRFKSDRDGFVNLPRQKDRDAKLYLTVSHAGDTLNIGNNWLSRYYETSGDPEPSARAFIFTDRSIYRPKQTVYFKGILVKSVGLNSSIVKGEYVRVYLEDANGDEVQSFRLKTNSFGSFSGEFKLPSSGLTGEFTIIVEEDDEADSDFYDEVYSLDYSQQSIRVEEYKRPTFEVTYAPITQQFVLNDSVSVTVNAKSFSGANLSNAQVSYQVTRLPSRIGGYYDFTNFEVSSEEEITHGEGLLSEDGTFVIRFAAKPDEAVSKDTKPVFQFEVTVDVTDLNGETITATQRVSIGYHTMQLKLNSIPTVNRRSVNRTIGIDAVNLNGQPIKGVGKIQIYKSKYPSAPVRPRPWSSPDLPIIAEEDFHQLFPHDVYDDRGDTEARGSLIAEFDFDTRVSKEIKYSPTSDWMLGDYIIEATSTDSLGNEVTARSNFRLIDPEDKTVADNNLLIFELDKSVYKVGDIARLKVGTASTDATVTVDVVTKRRLVKTQVETLSNETKELLIPVTRDMVDGVSVHYAVAVYNSFQSGSKEVPVVIEQKKLEIETTTFKDKLLPGSQETWGFKIKGPKKSKSEAELLASMYDASLDQFTSHEWYFSPFNKPYYYPRFYTSSDCFGNKHFTVRNETHYTHFPPKPAFDRFDWFGFTINNSARIKREYLGRLYLGARDSLNKNKVWQLTNNSLRKGQVAGTVFSGEDDSPLPGVNIVIKGTTIGTITNEEGEYLLDANAKEGDVLVYSFVGMQTAEVLLSKNNVINVEMFPDEAQLGEVIVTAMGIEVQKEALSSAVSKVMIVEDSTEVYYSMLEGKVAGVEITTSYAKGEIVSIRGAASGLVSGELPLYIVDGVPVDMADIDKSDLTSIEILKGNAAVALYGSRATNGAVIITTKSGQKKLDEELAQVNARKNFNETAFFYPHLTTDKKGRVQFNFTTPESLTRWKLQLLAHNKELTSGYKMLQAITQKDLMVTPNAPRFMRIGDQIIFSTKITNLTTEAKQGTVALQLTNAVTGESVDAEFKNINRNQQFSVAAKNNTQVSWLLTVPASVDAVQYKVVAKAGDFSDGEQNAIPVLSNRMLVTETMPIYVRGGETKTFTLDKLKTTKSSTLENHQLVLEVTSNPAWYAVQSLPYLIEFPYECSEQTFSRYFANTLASHFVKSNPNIRKVFDQWNASGGLVSNLEKNEELKSLIIQETPWLREAQSESEQKKRIAMLFDSVAIKDQSMAAIKKLQELQLSGGGFAWFAGSSSTSRYITQHIVSGFGHLKQLGASNFDETTKHMVTRAVSYLDQMILKDYTELLRRANERAEGKEKQQEIADYMNKKHIGEFQVHYLYARTFFNDIEITSMIKPAYDYYKDQAATYWKDFGLYSKGMISLISDRTGNPDLAKTILRSLKENSITSEELGMYWKENKPSWLWSESPIETQALLIEAFSEINPTLSGQEQTRTVDELRIWLLKNKQTSSWKTTKATTEAIYALLVNGTDWLSLDNQVDVSVGSRPVAIDKQKPETGTGYFKTSWKTDAISPSMSEVKFTKKDKGIAWGGLYWQYFEDLDKITSAETPLKLAKKVFLVNRTERGEVLSEVTNDAPIELGSLLRVRIELKVDRSMEFLHMKDMRASGLEPVDVLSEYKWQEGLGYYQSTRDASTNFFFDRVDPGVYVFEYDLRANNKGDFSNGITTIQSMYAPEFSSHSEGIRLSIK